ncbi:MarR family transcriptional regulator [Nocardioides sp. CFH 31398]|uniref:MarR family winged helix-turn-helix transcriptional regulator n=1 Tax=Nocardioides sp. CFH 31398 TaxID=2919579 RepID=UPI001F06D8DA|nr:MarR family transcriptional regulator [Nocardioides sp. CFH 31398]MCH1868457.1 MarR family transcriptional regulator [Nocardioides sp. CFH 31398]
MSSINAEIEQQLLTLHRRSPRLHVAGSSEAEIERSSYSILCLLDDEGPQRIGRIAQAFDLDPSTVTRQVQTVSRLGLVERIQDSSDRRATILHLTDLGRDTVASAREARRSALEALLGSWPEDDQVSFLRLLSRFNSDVADWTRRKDTSNA